MNKKISLTVLLLTLTACGGGNSPVSTLPSSTTVNIREQSKQKLAVEKDNSKDIIAKAEQNIGDEIDTSNYDTIVEIDNEIFSSTDENTNRSAKSHRRATTTNWKKSSELTETEMKYNLIQIYAKWLKSAQDKLEKIAEKFTEKKQDDILTNVIKEGVSIFVSKEEAENITKEADKVLDTFISKLDKIKESVEAKETTFQAKSFKLDTDFKWGLTAVIASDADKDPELKFVTDENGNAVAVELKLYEYDNNNRITDISKTFELKDLKQDEKTKIVSGRKSETTKMNVLSIYKDNSLLGVTGTEFLYDKDGNIITNEDGTAKTSVLDRTTSNQIFTDANVKTDVSNITKFEELANYINQSRPDDWEGADFEFLSALIGKDEESSADFDKVKKLLLEGISETDFNKGFVDLGNGYKLKVEKENNNFVVNYDLVLGGASANLSYTQFGYVKATLDIPVSHENEYYYYLINGGNDYYKSDITKVENGTKFTGTAVGQVIENIHNGNDSSMDLAGTVDLTVKDAENKAENIQFKFDNWYDINVDTENGSIKSATFTADNKDIADNVKEHFMTEDEGKITDLDTALQNKNLTTAYYGANNPTEVIGQFQGETHDWIDENGESGSIKFGISFGAKKK